MWAEHTISECYSWRYVLSLRLLKVKEFLELLNLVTQCEARYCFRRHWTRTYREIHYWITRKDKRRVEYKEQLQGRHNTLNIKSAFCSLPNCTQAGRKETVEERRTWWSRMLRVDSRCKRRARYEVDDLESQFRAMKEGSSSTAVIPTPQACILPEVRTRIFRGTWKKIE